METPDRDEGMRIEELQSMIREEQQRRIFAELLLGSAVDALDEENSSITLAREDLEAMADQIAGHLRRTVSTVRS